MIEIDTDIDDIDIDKSVSFTVLWAASSHISGLLFGVPSALQPDFSAQVPASTFPAVNMLKA